MKKASKILFLVGGILGIIIAVSCFFDGIVALVVSKQSYIDYLITFIKQYIAEAGVDEEHINELAKLFQIYLKVSGVSLFFMAAFAAVSSIVSFKARNNDSKKLFILNIVFGVISGVEVNLVGGILALIALKKQSNEENIEQKEETIAIE